MEKQIQAILDKLHKMLQNAVGPNNRMDYMREIGVSGLDWHFSLSADDIIKNKIPKRVIGCTGVAKVFCKLANEIGLECWVVCSANNQQRETAKANKRGKEPIISGHQIMAVKINGKLKMFDPGRSELKFLPDKAEVGGIINFRFPDMPDPYLIAAIMTPNEFFKIDSYFKLRNVYASGDMNNPEFVITRSNNTVN